MLFHEVKRRADAPFANGHSGIFLYLFITLCFGLTFVPASVDAATNVSGSITVNTTWSKANSPYIVSGNLTVNSGATLTIQPGVDVKFDGDYYFNVKGSLNAQGTSAERIRFTSNKATPAPDDWDGLFLGGPGNSLKYITIEYSNYAAFLSFADVTFDQSLIQYTWQGIYIGNNSRLVFSNSEIRNNTGSGITLSDSSVAAQITNNLITNNGGGVAVRYSTSSTAPAAIINNNRIYGNIDYNLWQSGPEYRKVANAGSNWWGSADPAVVMQGIKGSSITRAEINPILDGPNGNPITSFQILFGGYDSSLLLDNPQKSYYIFGYMKIGPAATLRVLPGVKIYFADGSNLDVFGSVDMQGTPDKRIELLPAGAIKA
ncbi:MAG: right-handed parallel beta-helix repeat-containing protein, partial [Candidatus Omnitrophica bacterium]|nr:right-handed parallel beta-helix repeat-containing protein [Candidatus Omnitrophota bacterium]